jgi:hypothetical protein
MRALLLSALLASLPGLAQARPAKVLPPLYQPDLAQWRLEVTPDLGGWITEGSRELKLKLVDPKDPDPPKDDEVHISYSDEEEGEEAAEPPEKTPEELRQERLFEEESARRTAWRDRRLLVWFNGTETQLSVRVGALAYFSVASQNGENRLEILEPDSGRRIVRSWWTSAARTRLMVAQVRSSEDEWGQGALEVLEPNGDLATHGRRTTSGGTLSWGNEYLHPNPAPGTYTLRWTGGYRGGRPFRVILEALLDGGTDQERRWRFERLVLPGAGAVTLGTLDVEN